MTTLAPAEPLAAPPRSTRAGPWLALLIFTATRALVLAVALLTPSGPDRPDAATWPDWWSPVPLMRWDAGHYRLIAVDGYPPRITDTVAFFPAYSITARPAIWLARALTDWDGAPDVALVVVAHLEAALAILLFYVWVARRTGQGTALLAVALLSAYPPAMFFSTGYPEGLFVLGIAAMLCAADRGRFGLAALATALCTAARPTGLAIAAVVTLLNWRWSAGSPVRRRVAAAAAVFAVACSGFAAYMGYLGWRYGSPTAFLSSQSSWAALDDNKTTGRLVGLKPLVEHAIKPFKYAARGEFDRLAQPETWNALLNLLVLIIAAVGLRRPGPFPRLTYLIPFFIFLMAYLPDPYNGTRMIGISRYQLAALPCFAALAAWRPIRNRPAVATGLLAALLILQCLYVRAYCRWELAS